MKKWERFIIYPLLIISLVYSFGGIQTATNAKKVFDKIVAKEIAIVDDGKELIKLSGHKAGGNEVVQGAIEVFNKTKGMKLRAFPGSLQVRYGDKNKNSEVSISAIPKATFMDFKVFNKKTNKLEKIQIRNSFIENSLKIYDSVKLDESQSEISLALENPSIFLGSSNSTGEMSLYNEHRDPLIFIGESKKGHGLINIYDKYSEDFRSYTHTDNINN